MRHRGIDGLVGVLARPQEAPYRDDIGARVGTRNGRLPSQVARALWRDRRPGAGRCASLLGPHPGEGLGLALRRSRPCVGEQPADICSGPGDSLIESVRARRRRRRDVALFHAPTAYGIPRRSGLVGVERH